MIYPLKRSEMTHPVYTVKEAGVAAAAARYGVKGLDALKNSAKFLFSSQRPSMDAYGPGFANGVKSFAHGAADFAREGIFGSPIDVAKEIGQKGVGRFYRDAVTSGGNLGMAVQALPVAMDLNNAVSAPEGHKGEAIGRALGSAAMSPLTSRLGIPGQMLLHRPVASFAGRIGRMFDPQSPKTYPSAPPSVEP